MLVTMRAVRCSLNFKLILISKVISVVGGSILGFVTLLFLVDFTQSAALLGMITMISQIPAIVIMPFAGMVADRMNKKNLIVYLDIFAALINFAFWGLLITGSYTILNITILQIVKVSVNTCATVVFNAAVPRIVDETQLVEANGAFESIRALGFISGSLVGGLLFGLLSIKAIAFATGVLFLVSAGISSLIKIPYIKQEFVGNIVKIVKNDMSESFNFLRDEKPIVFKFSLITSVLACLFPPLFTIALPFIVTTVLDKPVAIPSGISAIGMLVGGMLAGRVKDYLTAQHFPRWLFALGATCVPLVLIFTTFWVEFPISFLILNVALTLLTLVFALLKSGMASFAQKEIPKHLFGKIRSFQTMIALISNTFGILVMGIFIDIVPLPIFFVGLTAITWITAIVCNRILKRHLTN